MGINYQDVKIGAGRSGSDRRTFDNPKYEGPERRVAGDRRSRTDRRKYNRFKLKNVAYAVLKSITDKAMGELLDISSGGLAICYYSGSNETIAPFELDIISADNDFQLDNISIKTISKIPMEDKSLINALRKKRYCIQFNDLNSYQISELSYFIKNYTLSEAE